jgi:hypothetical protein
MRLKAPLKEGVLKVNCGVPIIFVINKSDAVVEHQNKKKLEEDSEFILSHIRLLALKYGATIIYTSGKTNINLTVLYDYICHILFNFELAHKPNFIEKEAYFIPSGYDNLNLLNSNEEIKKYLKETYEEIIRNESNEKTIMEEDIQCEDTNTFFEILKKYGVKDKKGEMNNETKKEEKDKRFEIKKKDIIEKLAKNKENFTNKEPEKKNKTRESMIAKLKNFKKKETLKKK